MKIPGVADLLRPEVAVVLPNPELAAVGKAAQQALASSGRWDAVECADAQPQRARCRWWAR